jgi:hypothetical protein
MMVVLIPIQIDFTAWWLSSLVWPKELDAEE